MAPEPLALSKDVWDGEAFPAHGDSVAFRAGERFLHAVLRAWRDPAASTDLLHINHPMLLAVKHGMRFWNPFVLCGTPAAASGIFPLFNPESWLLFLFSDRWIFSAYTLLAFVKLGAIGAVAYLFFRDEIGDERRAL